jgi:arylsulfatase A-like enzyme
MPFDQVPARHVEAYGDATPEELLTRPNVILDGPGERAPGSVKNYFAAVTGIDENFGRILATLEELGLADDTIVVVTSDHGEMMGSHGLMGKDVWYDESLLVPFIIRWPGRIAPGTDDLLLNSPDVMPTLLGLAGLAEMIPGAVEGADYSAAFTGGACERPESAYYHVEAPQFPGRARRRGVRTHRYTFVVSRRGSERDVVLHDNREDPYQTRNFAADRPSVVQDLLGELKGWLERTGDPFLDSPEA